jgi:hypothetical protein
MKITLNTEQIEAVEALIQGWVWMRPPDLTPAQANTLRYLANEIEEYRLDA